MPTLLHKPVNGLNVVAFLDSSTHEDRVDKPYDPSKLKSVFPNDVISLMFKVINPQSDQWQEKLYHITPEGINSFDTNDKDYPLRKNIDLGDFINSRSYKATPKDLEMLAFIHQFLQKCYQEMKREDPEPKQLTTNRFNFVRKLIGRS